MKKKVFSLMMTLLLAFMGVARAELVEIGDGGNATNSYLPTYSFYNYSITQQIYTAAEIGTAGTINSIAFYNTGTEKTRDCELYMVNTTVGSFASNNDWITVTAADKVFTGSVTFTADGWTVLTLDTPFAYDGTSNLAVVVDDNTSSYSSGLSCKVFDATGMSLRLYNDYTDYDPSDPPVGSGAVLNVKNQIQLDITPSGGGGAGGTVVVEIGDGGTATNSYLPTYNYFKYHFSEQLYTAAEIGTAGSISGIAFYNNGAEKTRTIDLYLVNTDKVSFASTTDWITVTEAPVFSGEVTFVVGDWTTITFDTPFAYDGVSNLAVIVDDNTGAYTSSPHASFRVFDAPGMALNVYSDGTNYDPAAPSYTGTVRNIKNQIQLTIAANGGGGGGYVDKLHVKYMDGEVEVIDELNMGVRPIGAWMEPFGFTMYSDGPSYTVNVLDFTPDHDLFSVEGEELPFQVTGDQDVNLTAVANGTQAGLIERQFVAITEGDRAAHVWPITVELYAPETPDVWELACQEATTFPFVEVPATAHNTTLHNDYTLPFPEIPEGYDAVYKLVFTEDQILDAEVTVGADGKVALYREGFEGQGGPMADNYYTGAEITGGGGGAAGAPFEAQIGEGTGTTGYFPFYTLYNYSIAENLFLSTELEAAGVTTAPMTSLSWYATNAPGYAQQGITIWMANVDDAALTTTSHVVTGMTKVYTGAMTPAEGWNEFVFNEGNFAWDGHSNILIYCQRNNGAWNSTVYWQATTSLPFNAMSYKYQDSAAYDATVPQTMSTSTTRPNIIMKSGNRNTVARNVVPTASVNPEANMNVEPVRDGWLAYDDGTYATSIGNSTAYDWTWATMYPASMLGNNNTLTKVAIYNTSYNVSDITIDIYQGGTSAPGTLIASKTVTPTEGLQEVTLNSPVTINPSQNLWIVLSEYGTYVLTSCYSTVANNQWVENDGWYNIGDLASSLAGYGWMIRAYVENSGSVPPTPPTPGTEIEYNAGPVIEDLPVLPGTYYLVASSTTPDFEVTINAENMPCPPVEEFAFNPIPADNAEEIEPASVTLSWSIPAYATGWRLIFGTTYHPEPNHPQTIMYPEDGSFTRTMANSYTVRNLWNNKNYFWRVEFNNDGCPEGVSSPVWGFTTHLNIPQGLTAVDETVFNDETIVLNWNAVADRTYRQYNVYRDGELIGHTQMNAIGNTTYTDGPLAYNMGGYTYYVTAVYDEGESAPSNTVNVKVSGRGNVDGHVYEQDGTTGIAGATVTMVGQDEFGVSHTYNFQTNAQGAYSGAVYAGSYNGSAAKEGYQGASAPVQGNPIAIVYNETTSPIDYMMDENFDPVCTVIAQYYPDSLDPLAPYVKVYWGCGLPGEEIIEPFETGDFSLFDWQIDPTYPWSITTVNPYEGAYCMKSGGAGVANVVSNMTVTVDIPADGEMSFFGKISCESSWDYGYFYIDGTQMGSYTGQGSWGEKKFNITEGTHTFQWRYTKDGSVNSYDDCFYVDYITFYKRPEPAGPGWHTYLESDFDNAYRSNVGDPSWGYEYPTSVLAQYAGYNLTKVAVFSDAMYSAVGGNFTCNVYKGGDTPASGTLAASITVDVPVGLDQWCEYDLNNAVNVTGSEPIYVLWTVNTYGGLGYPAGCASHASQYGDWWDPGDGSGWTHMGSCTWTMKNYFTNRAGRTVVLGAAELAHAPMTEVQGAKMDSHLRTFAKGETMTEAECVNPNAQIVPMASNDNTRALAYYRIYRTDCYNDGPYTEENTLLLASEVTDTVYIDVDWPDAAPGVYKWGVGCVYTGNRGELYESPITWGNTIAINNGEATRDELTYDFDNSSFQGWTTIDGGTPSGYGWQIASDKLGTGYGHNGSADCVLSQSYDNSYGVIYPDNYLISPQVQLGGSISFWACGQDANYAAEHFGVAVSTTTNTSASAFTMVQEWTIGSKGVNGTKEAVRGNRDQSTWTQYTVDLSAYSGMGYVAIRHFNCSDMFYLDVDDITINTSGGSGPTPPTPPTPGAGGLQEERESEIVWSNCLEKGMYLGEGEVDITVLLNSADSPEGVTVTFTNYSEVEQELYPVAPVVLDGSGYYAWDMFRKGNYELTIELDGYYSITDSLGIWDPTSLRYVMTEIIYGINDLYVSRTGWAMWEGEGPVGPGPGPGPNPGNGDTFSVNFDDSQIPAGWITIDGGSPSGYGWQIGSTKLGSTGNGHNGSTDLILSQSYDNNYGVVYPDNWLISPAVTLANGSTFSLWACGQDASYAAEHFGVFVSTTGTNPSDFQMVQEWTLTAKGDRYDGPRGDRAQGNWYQKTVDLSAFAGEGRYIAVRHFNCSDMFYLDVDDLELTNGAKSDRHLEFYKVMCTSIDGEPIYNENTVYPFCQLNTEDMVEGEHYICKVAAVYSTGMSDWTEAEWEYESCEHYAGTVNGLTIDGTTVSWDYPGGGPTPPQPGNGSTFSVNFDDSQIPAGWITIDGGSPSGYGWQIGSTKLGSTGNGHNGSADLILSQSYDNNYGVVYPDNWLISPAVTLANGSQFSLWACGQDASYAAEHFGVFVSTTGTNPSDFQLVQEWTLTAKGDRYDGARGNRDQGNWYQKTVDLSSFAGEGRYIAVRHFNCSDMFYLDVDDLELTSGAKGNRAPWDLMHTFNAAEAAQYGVATDGQNIYTCNWGYSSATWNFYKYDMQGNMIEGFNVSGCGTIRDLTYDGQYFYGGANSSVLYCIDLANHTLISSTSTTCSGIRHCSYDPVNDGFWVGGWSDLKLIDRSGATITNGPAVESVSGTGYFEDADGNPHLYLFTQAASDAKVYDYNILTNTVGAMLKDFSTTPGYDSGSSGGAFIGEYNGKIAFFGDVQQSPNLIGIYELADAGTPGPGPGPTPSGDILGAMIFVDGEWEAFVPVPTNSYTYEGEGNEICVRIVYNGTADLPSNNFYYAMSCEECEEFVPGPGTCEMPYVIHAEQLNENRSIKVWWGEEPAAPISEWLYYDDGTYATSVGAGGTIYWGTMFPAASLTPYAGTSLTKVALHTSYEGSATVNIYLGGSQPGGSPVSTATFNMLGDQEFMEINLTNAVPVDGTQNLWIIFYQSGVTYPADACSDTGDANNRWVSLDGSTWYDLAEAGLPGYGWMVRGYVTNQGKGGELVSLPEFKGNVGTELSHTEVVSKPADLSFMNRASIVKYNVYRSTDPAVGYVMIGEVAETGATYYEYIDTPVDGGTYYYQVRAYYDNDCESEPGIAADDPSHNYVSGTTVGDGLNENSDNVALYPNPTNGNVTIEANGMNRITVVSVLGQVVFDTELKADNYTLNMGQFNAGLYLVRVYTENGVTVKRVTVMQ